ncbi:hypothetical protein Ab1vBOLIVR5_gp199c [Agrobacterium phage OLIVR5]|uniref:Uncharacterized protein n=1 Tax=Agrobacterium phage OLIVR5 TaxID=2723773 RepID=A0A858MSU5_9CAUD|nr:hypothetical protein KNU99_gp202 [Agrobacterium phage OLIVR5]QIW87847.1 hypothetical protein Ab1vBOLIVR5_gp199c [Agrobacterium phage OLIVR5]QIW88112.1 hypothetical protein Ab1vBOLIVR6_gp205c [Agrobacterium phage OLIVR6]
MLEIFFGWIKAISLFLLFIVSVAAPVLIPALAWITHVVVCIKTSSWILLAFGAIIFPIGIIHGICVWVGIL